MEHCAPESRDDIKRDIDAAWAAIASATVDDSARASNWNNWMQYAAECQVDPYLRYCSRPQRQQVLLAFAARVCTGQYGNQKQVGHQTVEKALRFVAQTHVLAG